MSEDFSKAIHVEALDEKVYKVILHENFCIGSVPNGGYTAACMLAASKVHLAPLNQPDTFTSHFEYSDRAAQGPALVIVEEVKMGRQRSTLHLTLWQDGLLQRSPWITPNVSRRVVLAYTHHLNFQTFAGISLPTAWEAAFGDETPPAPDFAVLRAEGADGSWELHEAPRFSPIARSLHNWRFFLPCAGRENPGVVDIWVATASGQRITQAMIPYLADSFPYDLHVYIAAPELRDILQPKAKNAGSVQDKHQEESDEPRASLWFPTVVMDLEMKAPVPEEGIDWASMRIVSKKIQEGRYDLEVMIRTVDSEVLALSHHVAMIVSIEKNTKRRSNTVRSSL